MPGITLELDPARRRSCPASPSRPITNPSARVEPTSVDQRITAALADGDQPRAFSELRASCRVRTTTLYERLAAMTAAGLVVKSADGYRLAAR